MTLAQLIAFREVMLTGSISQAARNLGRTQPALSSTLASLERDLGFALFERRRKRLRPVPEAHYLLSEAETIIERLNTARRNISGLKSLEQGELRIVSMPGPSVLLVPGLAARLTQDSTSTKVQILSRSSAQVRQMIATQSYDVGIVDRGAETADDSQLVLAEPFGVRHLCALPADDPLARYTVIHPTDLDGRPLATLLDSHRASSVLKERFSAAGARLNVRYQAQFYLPLMTFVESGLAAAIIDVLSAESWCQMRGRPPAGIVFRPIAPEMILDCAILTPAQRPPSRLAQAFVAAWTAKVAEIEARWAGPCPSGGAQNP